MTRRYVLDPVQPIAGGYAIKDTRTGRIALIWSRPLARLIRDYLNTLDEG